MAIVEIVEFCKANPSVGVVFTTRGAFLILVMRDLGMARVIVAIIWPVRLKLYSLMLENDIDVATTKLLS